MKFPSFSAEKLVQLIGVASDIALLLDPDGLVVDVSVHKNELAALSCQNWVGRPLLEMVTTESIPKVRDMFNKALVNPELRWRHINHPSDQGEDVPIQYVALAFPGEKRTLFIGRDLGAIAVLQRRLVETQQSMERDYQRLRHIEARYRILFDTSSDPVILVDTASRKVTEANGAALSLLKDQTRGLVGRDLLDCFSPLHQDEVQSLLRMAHATGRIEVSRFPLAGSEQLVTLSVTVFRQDGGAQFLVRLLQAELSRAGVTDPDQALYAEALQRSPEGFVLTDKNGHIRSVNSEFMAMIGATALSQVQGQTLEQWLVRGGVDWGVLNTNLRQQASVKAFATDIINMSGLNVAVEISAVALADKTQIFAFFLRDTSRWHQQQSPAAGGMAGSVAELAHLVGRMPMKDIVNETSEMIERMCIQSALELTLNNRASAAEMLGLSRQSLYVKLHRFGMVDDNVATSHKV
jgi:transcriptional regulator PpsR